MINNLKALVVIMGIAIIVFAIAKPVCLRFMAEADFVRRRNIWFVLTIAAFVSPNFWLFAAVALPILAWGAHKDPNPLALYMLVFCVIPPISFQIPIFGINQLFEMNIQRLVAFAILIPVAWDLTHSRGNKEAYRITTMDLFVLAYAGLYLALLIPYESGTNTLRRGFLHFLDFMVLYFVASRACTSRQAIVEIMATFCLLCTILAPLAIFESQLNWLLYVEKSIEWGDPLVRVYMAVRGGSVRAIVSAGNSIPLGYMLAFGFGLWLYLSSHVRSPRLTVAFGILMWAGMVAAHARAPWIAAVFVSFTYLILGPNGPARFLKAFLVSAMLAGLVLVSPIGGRIIDNLPFIGSVDSANVIYRQELAKLAWEMVKRNPVFGDPFVLKNLESLRQGEGIIDLVNTYAVYAMYYGLTGLFLFLGPLLIGLWTTFRLSRRSARLDPDLSSLGAAMVACMIGFLLAYGMGGFGAYPTIFSIVVIGLSVTYSRLWQPKEPT